MIAAVLVGAALIAACGTGPSVDRGIADPVDALVWAYGLIPTTAERTELARLYQLDLEAAPQFAKDVAALQRMRSEMVKLDTLSYMERWAVLNSDLMRAEPRGQSTRYAHEVQATTPGSHRYCASSSVVLAQHTRNEYMCGGYRFAVMADSPRGYPALSYAPYDAPKDLQRVDWRTLTQRFQVVAEPSPGAPIAMRREGMELFFSVAPPR